MNEKFVICAPNDKKAKIIMNYVIYHIYDNDAFALQMDIEKDEKLKKETNKKRITFKGGGEVSILTLDARNSKRNIESAMGFGSPNVILDESSLIDDTLYATVKRMLGGYKENFLLEIGNPFYRNHFHRTWTNDDSYNKVFIDYHQALEEGRFTKEFIDEMRKEALFDIFYECVFPPEDSIDNNGYRQLILSNQMRVRDGLPTREQMQEELHLGIDVAGGGGNMTEAKLRGDNWAVDAFSMDTDNTMDIVGQIITYVEETIHKMGGTINWQNVHIDDVGIGRGVSDRLKELGKPIDAVQSGERAKQKTKFLNRNAEMSWAMKDWVTETDKDGKLIRSIPSSCQKQLTWYRWKVTSDKVIQMEPKKDMKERTGTSPDDGDALRLTFNEGTYVKVSNKKPKGM